MFSPAFFLSAWRNVDATALEAVGAINARRAGASPVADTFSVQSAMATEKYIPRPKKGEPQRLKLDMDWEAAAGRLLQSKPNSTPPRVKKARKKKAG